MKRDFVLRGHHPGLIWKHSASSKTRQPIWGAGKAEPSYKISCDFFL